MAHAKQFGALLKRAQRRSGLTQSEVTDKVAALIGRRCAQQTFSYWCNGKRMPQRVDLLPALHVLFEHGGLTNRGEINSLLEAGGYGALQESELKQWFRSLLQLPSGPEERIEEEVAPISHWSARVLGHLGRLSNDWSSERVLLGTAWITLWLIVWRFTFPLLRWPFADQSQAWTAVLLYAGATLVLPACTGALVAVRKDPSWGEQPGVGAASLTIFTIMGAFVGFHLAYSLVALGALVAFHVGLSPLPPLLEAALAAVLVSGSYAAARQAPINNLSPDGTLRFVEGDLAIVVAFAVFGPLFGALVYLAHPWLLADLGLLLILVAVGLLAALMLWHKRRGEDVLPAYVWAAIFGTMLVMYQLQAGQGWFSSALTTGFVVAVVILFARGRFYLTLGGGLGALVVLAGLLLLLQVDLWLGRAVSLLALLSWLRWGRSYLWFSLSFWAVVSTTVFTDLLTRQGIWPELVALPAFALMLILILWLDIRSAAPGQHLPPHSPIESASVGCGS
jgi:transcriptional regulator with XRE-family HTH domain